MEYYYEKTIEVGKVMDSEFDNILNEYDSEGIKYYKSVEPTFYKDLRDYIKKDFYRCFDPYGFLTIY